jgi:hypothetical protein
VSAVQLAALSTGYYRIPEVLDGQGEPGNWLGLVLLNSLFCLGRNILLKRLSGLSSIEFYEDGFSSCVFVMSDAGSERRDAEEKRMVFFIACGFDA